MSEVEVLAHFRRNVEEQIVTAVVEDCLVKGYFLRADYNGKEIVAATQDKNEIISNLMVVNTAYLHIETVKFNGWILLVFGEDLGENVVRNSTINLDETGVFVRANAITEAVKNFNFTIEFCS